MDEDMSPSSTIDALHMAWVAGWEEEIMIVLGCVKGVP